jgi:hypothetical protein
MYIPLVVYTTCVPVYIYIYIYIHIYIYIYMGMYRHVGRVWQRVAE